ncbi:MAG: NB-ARC domain-containing protein [Phormidesmis sp.]
METSVKVRKRGVVLTAAGLQRLNAARRQVEVEDNDGARFTLEELCDRTQLSLKTITKVLNAATSVDKQTLEAFFYAFDLVLEPTDYAFPSAAVPTPQTLPIPQITLPELPVSTHWGEAPDVSGFYGRDDELAQLYQWVEGDRCRLIGVLGMGGMGKTTLVTKAAQQLSAGGGEFTHIIWRSLRNAPSRDTVLSEWLSILSAHPETQPDLTRLISHLQNQRCLLVLDNVETILSRGRAGDYRPGYENYGELLRLLGNTPHQSCLILTSREKVPELVPLEGEGLPVRCLTLQGCRETAHQLIQVRGLQGTPEQQQQLCDRYSSSPLAIQIIAVTIRDLFDGDISSFLQQDALLFSGLRRLLDQQFERLSPLEKAIMFWLAINREGCRLDDLKADLLQPVTPRQLLEAIESLHWRCLIEKQSGAYTQQPVVMEYVTERLTEQVSAEILALRQQPLAGNTFLQCYALLKTTAKDYVRITQNRLILEPLCNLLQTTLLSRRAVVAHLKTTLDHYRTTFAPPPEAISASSPEVEPSYAAGNLLNLLCHLEADLTGIDVSGLAVWQAYLPNVPLPAANFAQADLQRSQLTERFGAIFAAVFTPDGTHFITGELSGYLRCWDVSDGQVRWAVQAGNARIHDLAISPEGTWLAVASGDRDIQFRDIATGRLLRSLTGHSDQVSAVVFHPQARLLASVSGDATVRLWDIDTGTCTHVFDQLVSDRQNHQLYCLRFSLDGTLLFSGDRDGTLKIWDLHTQQLQPSLAGHTDQVYSFAMHPQGQLLASSSADGTVKLWDIATRQLRRTLRGHSDQAISVRFSPDGTLLASSGSDATICFWDVQTGRLIQSLSHGHWVRAIAFSPDGRTLLSGCGDYSIKLWDVSTGNLLRTWSGYSNWFWAIAWSQDGTRLVSGCGDHTVRLWDVTTGDCLHTLWGHSSWVLTATCNADCSLLASGGGDNTVILWDAESGKVLHRLGHGSQVFCVEFSPTAAILASGGCDYAVRLWDVPSGQLLKILRGHQDWVRAIAFSPDGQHLVSVGQDLTMTLWDVSTGDCLRTWQDFDNWIWSVRFHPAGDRLVTASGTVMTLWDIHTGAALKTYRGHTNRIRSAAISPDGRWLVSGGQDNLIHLWDLGTGEIFKTFSDHGDQVMSVNFSANGRYLASSSADETIRIWNLQTGQTERILKAAGLYEGMNVSGIQGLSGDAIATLKQLGAIESL